MRDLDLIKRLIDRLERLSADSTYAHQASGLRGTLLRYVESLEAGIEVSAEDLNQVIEAGFEILKNAAKEVGVSG